MRYLVVRTDFLGDTVLSSTFIQMLKQTPGALIDSLCYPYNFAAFKYNPSLENKYLFYPDAKTSLEIEHNTEVVKQLQQCSYEAVFMLNRDLKSYANVLPLVQTKNVFGHRLGVRSSRSKIFCYLTEIFKKYKYIPYDNSIHEVVNQVNLLKFGLDKLGIKQNIDLDPNCYFFTESFNPFNGAERDASTVVINISGRAETVRYIPSALARCVIEDVLALGKKVLIIATTEDKERATQLINLFNSQQVKLSCETSLFKTAEVLCKYEYFIGADGGLLHIAAGLSMRCVGLFHAQNIEAWHPWSKTQICIQTPTKKIYDLTALDVLSALHALEGL